MHEESYDPKEEKEILSLSTNGIKWLFVGIGAVIVALIAFAIGLAQKGGHKAFKQKPFYQENMNQDELLDNWAIKYNFFHNDTIDDLLNSIKNTEFLTKMSKHASALSAGESVPIGHPDCNHPFMVQNLHFNICHFSNRIDVGRHFLNTGGFSNDMETSEKMLSRILLFYQRQTEFIDRQEFKEDGFLKNVQNLCSSSGSPSKHIVDVFQFNVFLLLAGQEVPIHVDTPYFYGADRTRFPEWLLVLMKQSKLFKELEIKDIKGSIWLTENLDDQGGSFYLYPEEHSNNYTIFKSVFNRGIVFDGTQLINGVTRFLPDESILFENRTQRFSVKYDRSSNQWGLHDASDNLIRLYSSEQVKLSAIWRAHCFENEQAKVKFNSQRDEDYLTIYQIAERFKNDLKSNNKLPTEDIKLIDLWTIVLKEYLDYPKNVNPKISFFIFNYCLLPNVMPQWINENLLNPLLKDIC